MNVRFLILSTMLFNIHSHASFAAAVSSLFAKRAPLSEEQRIKNEQLERALVFAKADVEKAEKEFHLERDKLNEFDSIASAKGATWVYLKHDITSQSELEKSQNALTEYSAARFDVENARIPFLAAKKVLKGCCAMHHKLESSMLRNGESQ